MTQLQTWQQLGGLMFVASRLVEGLWAGKHPSIRHGSGLDFHDYRIYCPGDALAQVDWKLFGRTDRHYIKRYRQLTDLHAYILLDSSASMNFAGLTPAGRRPHEAQTKFEYATTLAAAIAFLAVRQVDRVGLGLFTDALEAHLSPRGTWADLKRLVATLEAATPRRGVGDIAAALKQSHALLKRRGLLVVISDLLDEPEGLFDGLSRFRHDRFEIMVFQVLTPMELDLRTVGKGSYQMLDAETRGQVRTHIGRTAARYNQLMADHLDTVRRGCLARGIDYNLLSTDQPVVQALRRYLIRRAGLSGG